MRKMFSTPIKIGLSFGAIGLLLTIIGIIRGTVPANPASIGMALLIGGGIWFIVSWAVAAAAFDVESDIATGEQIEQESQKLDAGAAS